MEPASRQNRWRLLVAALLAPGIYASSAPNPLDPWPSISPSDKLEWHPCFNHLGFSPSLCARLTVPMHYRPGHGSDAKVHIALLLKPSTKTLQGLKTTRSPLLINPGGPGAAGTQLALASGDAIQNILGGAEEQDVIGFDPRGVGASWPRADCWTPVPPDCQGGGGKASQPGECQGPVIAGYGHRMQWLAGNDGVGLVNSSSAALPRLYARFRAVNSMCRLKDAQAGHDASILRYASTPFVARDMLSIVDAWDAWQETLAEEEPAVGELKRRHLDPDAPNLSTKGKLVYWGFSYGSYLGSTFAKLFPDRVGRIAIDGVLDAYQYGSTLWADSLHDTDAGLRDMFRYCFEAGDRCQFRRDGDAEPADVEHRFWALMERLHSDPPVFTLPDSQVPVVVTSELVKRIVFRSLYTPIPSFADIVDPMLNLLHEDRAEKLGDLFRAPDSQTLCNSTAIPTWTVPHDAVLAIMCSDKREPINETVAQMKAKFERLGSTSYFSDIWMEIQMVCNQWGIESLAQQHRSPWDPSQDGNATETAFPLLLLSNTHDPVTPLVSALHMATAFKDAGLVEQRSGGHCTVSMASVCTARILRAYFLEGKVPPPPGKLAAGPVKAGGPDRNWTVCEVDEWPWKERATAGSVHRATAGSGDDEEMLDQLKIVRDSLHALRDATGDEMQQPGFRGLGLELGAAMRHVL